MRTALDVPALSGTTPLSPPPQPARSATTGTKAPASTRSPACGRREVISVIGFLPLCTDLSAAAPAAPPECPSDYACRSSHPVITLSHDRSPHRARAVLRWPGFH